MFNWNGNINIKVVQYKSTELNSEMFSKIIFKSIIHRLKQFFSIIHVFNNGLFICLILNVWLIYLSRITKYMYDKFKSQGCSEFKTVRGKSELKSHTYTSVEYSCLLKLYFLIFHIFKNQFLNYISSYVVIFIFTKSINQQIVYELIIMKLKKQCIII